MVARDRTRLIDSTRSKYAGAASGVFFYGTAACGQAAGEERMKTVLGCVRKADKDFDMIASGDRIAVGVSGGKDSLMLLEALALYRRFSGKDFEIRPCMITLGLEPYDTSKIEARCAELGIPLTIRKTEIAKIIFDVRQEKNPCALCAKMRRGVLTDTARELGCGKLALGHHREDVLETLMMSLIFEGRIHTFHPVTYLSRSGITVIRPLVYVPEKHIIHMKKVLDLPVLANPCPADRNTRRQEMKELLASLAKKYPNVRELMLSALRNPAQYGLWDRKIVGKKPDGEA